MSLPSPCTSICRIAPATGWCEGCFRTLDEIAAWGTMDDPAKAAVWQVLPLRREATGSATTPPGPGAEPGPPVGGSYPR